MAKATFPETTGQESLKPASGGSPVSTDMRNALSALFQGDIASLRPRAQATPNMTIAVNPAVLNSFYSQTWGIGNSPFTYAGGNTSSMSAPSANPRIDIVYLTVAGALAIVTGAEAGSPVAAWANLPKDGIPLCLIYHKTTETKIVNYEDKDLDSTQGYIYQDVRPLLNLGGGATIAEMQTAQDNIALLAFRLAVVGSLSYQLMEDGVVDEYEDETGIDTGASTAIYDSSNDLYYNDALLATGGTITSSGGKTIHKFVLADSGTNFVVPAGGLSVDYLVIAGGGGGGGGGSGGYGGGGGAGGYKTGTGKSVAAGSYAITVGDGGAGATNVGVKGSNSVFSDITSTGGGGGGHYNGVAGAAGGSGGGGGYIAGAGGAASPAGQGNAGGGGGAYSGGGGGSSQAGNSNGTGGNGTSNSISGGAVTYAGGGGSGYGAASPAECTGGSGGGGNGGLSGQVGHAGTDNLGGGGGGGAIANGGDGGSGVVIISYTTPSVQNLDLRSAAFTAEAVPSEARLVIFQEDIDACTVNTDVKGYVSRDGGSTYTQITLVDEGDYATSKRILAGSISVSAQPSGSSMKYKVVGANLKKMKIHGASLLWKS